MLCTMLGQPRYLRQGSHVDTSGLLLSVLSFIHQVVQNYGERGTMRDAMSPLAYGCELSIGESMIERLHHPPQLRLSAHSCHDWWGV